MRVSNSEHNGAKIFMRLHSIFWWYVIAISQNEILSEIWITKITYMNFSMSLDRVNFLGDDFCFTNLNTEETINSEVSE